MTPEQEAANRRGNWHAVRVITYAFYCAIVIIGGNNGAALFKGKIFGFCSAPLFTLFFIYLLWNFLIDVFQYWKQGWNFAERRPRLTFYPGEEPPGPNDPPLSPEITMWVAYPGFILIMALFVALSFGQIFGLWGVER